MVGHYLAAVRSNELRSGNQADTASIDIAARGATPEALEDWRNSSSLSPGCAFDLEQGLAAGRPRRD
jgi:hypothetical protein